MKLTIIYRLTGRGWSETTLTDGNRSVSVRASYLSDALADLSEVVLALLRGADHARCRFADEPGEHRWLFERRGERLAVTIRRFPTTFSTAPDEAGTVIFAAEGTLRRFAVQVSNQLQALLERHGAEGYQALWNHPFPARVYEHLAAGIRATRLAHRPVPDQRVERGTTAGNDSPT